MNKRPYERAAPEKPRGYYAAERRASTEHPRRLQRGVERPRGRRGNRDPDAKASPPRLIGAPRGKKPAAAFVMPTPAAAPSRAPMRESVTDSRRNWHEDVEIGGADRLPQADLVEPLANGDQHDREEPDPRREGNARDGSENDPPRVRSVSSCAPAGSPPRCSARGSLRPAVGEPERGVTSDLRRPEVLGVVVLTAMKARGASSPGRTCAACRAGGRSPPSPRRALVVEEGVPGAGDPHHAEGPSVDAERLAERVLGFRRGASQAVADDADAREGASSRSSKKRPESSSARTTL